MLICIEIGSFVFELQHSQVSLFIDERTNKRTDEWMKEQVENIMRLASLYSRLAKGCSLSLLWPAIYYMAGRIVTMRKRGSAA